MDQKHYNHMMQNFDPNHDHFGPQAVGMEFLAIPSSLNPQNPSPDTWQQVDDSSLLCLLPGEENLPQSQGLSLSLCHPENNNPRDGFLSQDHHHHHQLFLEDGRFFQLQQSHMKYLLPVQELLNEFCNLGAEGNLKRRHRRPNHWEEGAPSSSPSGEQSLSSMDLLQLQKRKAKLLTMLDEVDRRYRRYCEQMRAVVSSFEAVAGDGAATVYSTLASKAMSRHFRALRDGIVDQLSVTKKAIGEKDASALGTTRGETPRLKVLDLRSRQEKAIQQAGMSESPPWRPQRGLPDRAVSVLRAWLFEHFLHPYPSDIDKHILARQTGLSRSQVSNWFINARVRLWKPMVEEMYTEELKVEQEDVSGRSGSVEGSRNINIQNPNPRPGSLSVGHQQNPEQQLPRDPDSLASVIISARRPGRGDQSYGGMDMDFSSYSGFGDVKLSGGNVSLTLGLQQKQQQQQNAGYRNFEGVQLLHDC